MCSDGHAGDRGADVDDHGHVAFRDAGGAAADQLEGGLRGVGLDVHHDGLQAGGLRRGDAVLDLFLAGGRDQHLDLVLAGGRRAEDLEVEVDLVQGEGDVLVGLALDLDFHVLFALVAGQDHLLGDDRRGRQGQRDVLDPGAEGLVGALDRLARGLDIGDVAVHHRVLGQRLDRVALDAVDVSAGFRDLHHLHRRRADVAADEGRRLGFQEVELGG